MEPNVVRFPVERRRPSERLPDAVVSAAEPAPAEALDSGERFALLSVDLRRGRDGSSNLLPETVDKILNRCVLAALEVLSRARADLDLAGTTARPVVEATFRGDRCAIDAASAALAVRDVVRRVQREIENEFQVFGALCTGTARRNARGVRVTSGSTESVVARLRERAGPGQVLVARPAWEAGGGRLEGDRTGTPAEVGLEAPIDVYVLSAVR